MGIEESIDYKIEKAIVANNWNIAFLLEKHLEGINVKPFTNVLRSFDLEENIQIYEYFSNGVDVICNKCHEKRFVGCHDATIETIRCESKACSSY